MSLRRRCSSLPPAPPSQGFARKGLTSWCKLSTCCPRRRTRRSSAIRALQQAWTRQCLFSMQPPSYAFSAATTICAGARPSACAARRSAASARRRSSRFTVRNFLRGGFSVIPMPNRDARRKRRKRRAPSARTAATPNRCPAPASHQTRQTHFSALF